MRLFIPQAAQHAHDERCACGHARSAHDDRWASWGGRAVAVPGHGACDVPGCPCRRFRWAGWVFAAAGPHRAAVMTGRRPAPVP